VLAIIAAAALLLGVLRGVSRQVVFLALNLTFLVFCLLGPRGTAVTLCFSLLGYALIAAARARATWAFAAGVSAFVLLFVYMKHYTFLDLLLPPSVLTSALSTVGLSFLFFKILHVVIDARSGTLGALDGLTYVNYCTNFTTFTMGPIQRYQDHRAQWLNVTAEPAPEESFDAVIRILVGLIKAYVLAEWIKPYTELLTDNPTNRSIADLVVGIYSFNLYLYLNFSGYCDVMIGAGMLFGVRPPENFDRPFLARNVSDFWQRQHRSLTLWLTDYVFTPTFKRFLEMPRLANHLLLAVSISLMVTMTVSGLWHGTTVGFLLFGLVHGGYLVLYRSWDAILTRAVGRKGASAFRGRWWVHALAVGITFNAVSFSFVFFVLDAQTAIRVLGRMVWP
jgi:D-alanyl-lipoteichoic acid acyltransferase DltB (MBOAT superfamily)